MTGAGISAESGIPTFRARRATGRSARATTCLRRWPRRRCSASTRDRLGLVPLPPRRLRAAQPNAGHTAVVRLERALGDRFLLITQNVDGLHLRAGSSPGRTYQIHGNIDFGAAGAAAGRPPSCSPSCRPRSAARRSPTRSARCCAARPAATGRDRTSCGSTSTTTRALPLPLLAARRGRGGGAARRRHVGGDESAAADRPDSLDAGATIVDINPRPTPSRAWPSARARLLPAGCGGRRAAAPRRGAGTGLNTAAAGATRRRPRSVVRLGRGVRRGAIAALDTHHPSAIVPATVPGGWYLRGRSNA